MKSIMSYWSDFMVKGWDGEMVRNLCDTVRNFKWWNVKTNALKQNMLCVNFEQRTDVAINNKPVLKI